MGEVYRADDLRLGQPVALKFLPEDLHHDPIRLAQFHNEVRTARQVSHANVCRVYDIGEIDGLLYLSMEYVDGEDLATSLRRIGRFPEDKAADIARQLCAGLAAAHQRGVIHRDLKPANVMLDGAGRVRVMDFGLAAVGRVEDIRAGTPAYMAPEQLQGREVTARSDIFALGLVMYELFTGRRAFTAATVGDLVDAARDAIDDAAVDDRHRDGPGDRARHPAVPRSGSGAASRLGARGVGGPARRRSAGRGAGGRRDAVARDGGGGRRGRGARAARRVAGLRGGARGHGGVVRDGPANQPARQDAAGLPGRGPRAESARRPASARHHRAPRRRSLRVRLERRPHRAREDQRQARPPLGRGLLAAPLAARVLVPAKPRTVDRNHVPQRPADARDRGNRGSSGHHVGHDRSDAGSRGAAHVFRNDPGPTPGRADRAVAGRLGPAVHARRSGPDEAAAGGTAVELAGGIRHARRLDRHLARKRTAAAGRSRGARRPSGGVHAGRTLAQARAHAG